MNVVDTIQVYFHSSIDGLEHIYKIIVQYLQSLFEFSTSAGGNHLTSLGIEFSDLQIALLKIVLFILFGLLVLNGIYWRKYGEIITEKFIRPSTLKEIEELKLSVAKLKLPKEHSPRI